MKREKSVKRSQEAKTQAVDIDNLTTFEKFEHEVKTTVFNVLYVLLKDDETVLWKMVALSFSDFFQIYQFTFVGAVEFPWRSEQVSLYYNTFLDQFQVAVWLARLDLTTYIIVIYIMIFIVILIIMDIFYVSYSFTRKKFTFVWPLQALRSSVGLFVTVLFLPFLESFTSMLYCVQAENGTMTLAIFPDLVCWTGPHIIHTAFAIAVSIVFIVICIIVTLTYFDNSITSTDIGAKVNSRAESFVIILKIILNYLYTFFATKEYHWLLLAALMVLSFTSYRIYRYNWPYFNDGVTKFYCCLTGNFLWGNINLLIIKLLEGTEYSGGFQLYFLGLPLLIALIVFEPDERVKLLLKNINNFDSGEDVALQIRYYLRLVQTKDTNRKNNVILKGYIYHHEDFCPNQDCKLKTYKKKCKALIGQKKAQKKNGGALPASDELNEILMQHAKSLYRAGITKFPECTALKIQYALFLMYLMDNKPEAVVQLQQASQLNPSFDEQFVIFRLSKLIEDSDDGLQDSNKSGLDIVAKLAFESTLRQIQEGIQKSAQLHYDFWNQLKLERPDISKLNEIGAKINTSIRIIDDQWTYLQKINPSSPRALKMYAKFLIEILNDKQRGLDLIQRARESVNSKFNAFDQNSDDILDIQNLNASGTPCIMIDGNTSNLGQITMANTGAAKLFGYSNQDIEKYNINKLMPELYQRHHSKIVEKAINNDQSALNTKERFIFGKHKSGYIFPVIIQIKIMQNAKTGFQFIAMFKTDKKLVSSFTGYLLINREKKIIGVTSNMVNILSLDNKKILKMNSLGLDMTRVAPDIFDLELQQQKTIEWNMPDFEMIQKTQIKNQANLRKGVNNQLGKQSRKSISQENLLTNKMNLLSTLNLVTMGEYGEIGWFIKVQPTDDKNTNDRLRLKKDIKKDLKQPLFQFRYDERSGKFIREMRDVAEERKQGRSNWFEDRHKYQPVFEAAQNQAQAIGAADVQLELKRDEDPGQSEDAFAQKRRWGRGIQIYRLVKGKFQPKEYDEELKKQQEMENERKRKLEEEERQLNLLQNGGANDPQTIQKNRKALQIAFNDKSTPKAITNLRIVMNIVIVSLLALTITEFVVNNSQFKDINENFNLIRQSYNRISEIQRIAYDVRTLVNINERAQTVYRNYTTAPDFINYLKSDIEEAMNNLFMLQGNISLTALPKQDKQSKLINEKSVNLYFKERSSQLKILTFTLHEAVLQISSAIFSVRHMNITDFYEDQEDVFFITYNAYNDFLIALENSSIYYVEDLKERARNKQTLLMIIFIVTLSVVVITSLALLPMIFNVNKVRIKVLSLFVDIPQANVEELADKCEDFMLNIENDHNDEMQSNDDGNKDQNGQKEDGSDNQKVQKQKKTNKIPRNAQKSNNKFFIQFGVSLSCVLAYFIGMFILSIEYLQNIDLETQEINVLAQAEFQFALAQNAQREMIYNSSKPLLNGNSFQVSKDMIEMVNSLSMQILDSKYSRISAGNYRYSFQRLYTESLCTEENKKSIGFELIGQSCETMLNSAANNGLQLVLLKYFETLKENLKYYVDELEKPNFNATETRMRLFNSDRFIDLYIMQFRIIQDGYRYLVEVLKQEENLDFQQKIDTRIGAFIFFIIAIFMFYLILWTPYVNNLNAQIWRTKSMLTIIPLDVIVKMPKIQEFLNAQNFFSSKRKH